MTKGKAFDIHAAGMLALDVSRIEAGLLLIDVDFNGTKKALIGSQKYTPLEMGLGRLVALDKGRFVGQDALRREAKEGPAREIVGLELDWNAVEAIYEQLNLAPQIPAAASRVAVPVYRDGRAGRQGDLDDVVADAQEDDRARDGRAGRATPSGRGSRWRSRSRPCGTACPATRRQDAVLQSAAEDRDAGRERSARRAHGSLGQRDPRLLRREGPARGGLDDPGALVRRRPRRRARAADRLLAHLADGRARSTSSRSPASTSPPVLAGEPIVVVRGEDGVLRGFFNVCRHHAAAVMTEPEGKAPDPALPVPRLDVLARGRAQGHAGLRRRLRLRQGQERPHAGRDGDVGEVRLRAPRAGRPVARAVARAARRPVREARPRRASTSSSGGAGPSTATGRSSSTTTSTAATTCRTCTRACPRCSTTAST